MELYKGRSVQLGMVVDVYRNLHKDGYSIRDSKKGLVLAHCDSVRIMNAKFVVSESGRQKTIAAKRKRVHAYIRGILVGIDEPMPSDLIKVYYNPYETPKFTDISSNEFIESAQEVYCTGKYAYMKRKDDTSNECL